MTGRFARRGHGEGEADEEGDVDARPSLIARTMRDRADDERGDARDAHFLAGALLFAVVDDVRVEVVREAGAGAHREAGDDGEDRGEGDGADEGEEHVAAERLREQRRDHVAVRPCRRAMMSASLQDRRRAEAEERRQDVEDADDRHRPDHADARGLRIRHGVEADEDVRQAGGAEHEAEARAR